MSDHFRLNTFITKKLSNTLFSCFFLLISSCHDPSENTLSARNEWKATFRDVPATMILAGYQEGSGFSLIVADQYDSLRVRKLTRWKGFPEICDTLRVKNRSEFMSTRFNRTYLINDSEVVEINHQKIIHPSSNWKGQTPWSETIESRFSRIDR
jgi:hypothetical protein